MSLRPPDIDVCPYCKRSEIEVLLGQGAVTFEDAPPIGFSSPRICSDCELILRHAIRIGALALRKEFAHQRQLDLFEGPTDRVIRRLCRLEGTDAPI